MIIYLFSNKYTKIQGNKKNYYNLNELTIINDHVTSVVLMFLQSKCYTKLFTSEKSPNKIPKYHSFYDTKNIYKYCAISFFLCPKSPQPSENLV